MISKKPRHHHFYCPHNDSALQVFRSLGHFPVYCRRRIQLKSPTWDVMRVFTKPRPGPQSPCRGTKGYYPRLYTLWHTPEATTAIRAITLFSQSWRGPSLDSHLSGTEEISTCRVCCPCTRKRHKKWHAFVFVTRQKRVCNYLNSSYSLLLVSYWQKPPRTHHTSLLYHILCAIINWITPSSHHIRPQPLAKIWIPSDLLW